LFRDGRTIVGASDAGAHLNSLCGAGDTSLLLQRHVHERRDFSLEHAVHILTQRPARMFGVHDRGVVAPGHAGDLVVFELDHITWPDDYLVQRPRAAPPLASALGWLQGLRRQQCAHPDRRCTALTDGCRRRALAAV
jgi:N-acyl-D-aspartate/D-glutamate deacylase